MAGLGHLREGLHVSVYPLMNSVTQAGHKGSSRAAIESHLPVTTFHNGGAIHVRARPAALSFYLCVKWLVLHRLPLWGEGCRWVCIMEPRVLHYGRYNCESLISLPVLPAADTPRGSTASTRIITAATTAAAPPHLP